MALGDTGSEVTVHSFLLCCCKGEIVCLAVELSIFWAENSISFAGCIQAAADGRR